MVAVGVCAVAALAACRPGPAQPVQPLQTRSTPVPAAPANARAIECPTSTSCYAVAASAWNDVHHWDGTSWKRLPIDPPQGESWPISALSCPTSDVCYLAGGSSGDQLLLLRWDGSAVTRLAPGTGSGSDATQVSCPTAQWCLVWDGFRGWTWDGSTLTPVYRETSSPIGQLSCAAPTMCMAWSDAGVVRWDGTSWTPSALWPRTLHQSPDVLYGPVDVSCPTISFCAAVTKERVAEPGRDGPRDEAHVATWNGRTWSAFHPVGPPAGGERHPVDDLGSLSCGTPQWCVAHGRGWTVDAQGARGEPDELILVWTGEAWRRGARSADEPAMGDGFGRSLVSCARAERWCLAQPSPDEPVDPLPGAAVTPAA